MLDQTVEGRGVGKGGKLEMQGEASLIELSSALRKGSIMHAAAGES